MPAAAARHALQVAAAAARARSPWECRQPGGASQALAQPQAPQQQQELPGCEDGEVCGHSLRPGVLLQPGQPTTTTLTLRAPPPLQLVLPPPRPRSERVWGPGGAGTDGEGMSDVELSFPPPSWPSAACPAPLTSQAGSSTPAHKQTPPLQQQPSAGVLSSPAGSWIQGAGALPLPHPLPCSPRHACSVPAPLAVPFSGLVAADPAATASPGAQADRPAAAGGPVRMGGPLGFWYGPAPTAAEDAAPALAPSRHAEEPAVRLAGKGVPQGGGAAHALGRVRMGQACSAEPAVDVAVVWCMRAQKEWPGGRAGGGADAGLDASQGSSGGGSASGGVQGAGSEGSAPCLGSAAASQLPLAPPAASERLGILWLRDVLRSAHPPLPLVRAALSVADPSAPASAPPSAQVGQLEGAASVDGQGPGCAPAGSSHGANSMGMRSVEAPTGGGDGCSAGSSIVVAHSFAQQPACILQLRLEVRNAAADGARLVVQVCLVWPGWLWAVVAAGR